MDHGFKLHPDGTLEITLSQGTNVGRVLVCEAGTQNGSLYYPESDVPDATDCTDCIKHGRDWECDRTHCRKGTKQQATKASDCVNRRDAIKLLANALWSTPNELYTSFNCYENCEKVVKEAFHWLPSAEPEPLSDAYMKAVWTWLLDYQIKVAELEGIYTPYEVLSWVANDWRKEHE